MKINAVCKTPDPEGRRKVLQAIYDKHRTLKKAGKACGVDEGTFCRWCKRYGVETKSRGYKRNVLVKGNSGDSIDWEGMAEYLGFKHPRDMLKYYTTNYSNADALKELGVTSPSYWRAIKAVGIKNNRCRTMRTDTRGSNQAHAARS